MNANKKDINRRVQVIQAKKKRHKGNKKKGKAGNGLTSNASTTTVNTTTTTTTKWMKNGEKNIITKENDHARKILKKNNKYQDEIAQTQY